MSDMKLEKRTGWDWDVVFLNEDGSNINGTLFGVITIEQVILQAHDDLAMLPESVIISIVRRSN